jgi:predicted nuclease of restriction endonuclease-like RecB superfamily
MLTADLAQNRRRGNRVRPLYIPTDDAGYLEDASHLIELFHEHEGLARRELDQSLEAYVGTGTDYKILRGFIKLLTDRCDFDTSSAVDPVEIRRALFRKARAHHPLALAEGGARREVILEAARELACEPQVLMQRLYADLPENQTLTQFKPLDAAALLDLYNLAQAQALLYRCTEMRLFVETQDPDSYRELFSAIKAYRLIHTIRGSSATGYEVLLDGPVSIFHRSQKYGIQMAVFLPALLLCRNWRMQARITQQNSSGSTATAFFELDHTQRQLHSHYLSAVPLENPVSEKLAASWGRVETLWQLEPSREVIDLGESAFIPDYVLRHQSGGHVFHLEILGFWTPQHLKERLREFEHAGVKNFLLAAWDELRGSRDPLTRIPAHTIIFKKSLNPVAVELAANELISGEQ